MRILYLHGTYVPPPADPKRDRFYWLSQTLEGDILQEIWFQRPEDVERELGPGSYPTYTSGRFRYHFLLGSGSRGLRNRLALGWFFISAGLKLHKERGFDCVVTYSHTLTAICGVILKLLTRAKLIVEIVGDPNTTHLSQIAKATFRVKAKRLYSDLCLHVCLWCCDRAHLLAEPLLSAYGQLRNVPRSVFFEAVPTSLIPRHVKTGEDYVLIVGAPWRLKGVDLLIAAFQRLSNDFPKVTLKLLGHYPDREELEALVAGSPRIEFLTARPNPEVLEIISKATVFVLPSRSEGVPRVILEAMAAGVPVVASDAGGIPSVVRHGESGFVVPVGDIGALETRLRQLLSDRQLRDSMGAKAHAIACAEYNEAAYVDHFTRMIEATVVPTNWVASVQAGGNRR
jgi:glycosyltransferase involved in cell wall biosynthesis